jgi:signal transduction histidine kinase
MPDRLVQLYGRMAAKMEELDGALRAMVGKDDRPLAAVDGGERRSLAGRVQKSWEELLGIVAEQKELLGEIAQRTQELSSLSNFLQTHYEREKARLARELHDELGGILTPAKMDLVWMQARLGDDVAFAERMARLSALIDQGIDLKRRVIEELHPSLLDHLGLATAVKWFAEEACRGAKLECHVDVSPRLERLSPDLEIALYRLVQESVNNAVRHAKAAHIAVTLERTAEELRITVTDDGEGIANLEEARKLSHGLAGMYQRMRALDGTFKVHTMPGKGTRIEAFLPLES